MWIMTVSAYNSASMAFINDFYCGSSRNFFVTDEATISAFFDDHAFFGSELYVFSPVSVTDFTLYA
jgi:hypothetical protein